MNQTWKALAAGALALGVAACADNRMAQRATPPPAEDYGAFAYDGGKLHRLAVASEFSVDNPGAWTERVALGPNVRFVVQDPALPGGTLERRIRLVRMMHARDVAYDTPGERSGGLPEWLAIDTADTQAVPVSFDTYGPMATDNETNQFSRVVEVIPRKPLSPGMYALYVEGQETTQLARFGVRWAEADKVAFDDSACVTRVADADVSYQTCPPEVARIGSTSQIAAATAAGASAAAARVPDTEGLELRLLDPVSQTIGGENYLLVSGEITNTSGEIRQISQVKVSLKDANGAVLREWDVMPQEHQLQPGAMTQFNATVNSPPPEAARIAATIE